MERLQATAWGEETQTEPGEVTEFGMQFGEASFVRIFSHCGAVY